MKRLFCFLVCLWLLPSHSPLCRGAAAAGASKVTVRDALGRDLDIALPVRRMVVLSGDAMEVVRILKAQDRVVGITDFVAGETGFWGSIARRPAVGKWNEPNYEVITDLYPDLVLCYGRNPGPEAERKFKALGIALLRLDFYRPSTLLQEVATLGKVLQREHEAQAFITWYQQKLDFIAERTTMKKERPSVYLESYSDFHTCGPGSGIDEMCILAGGYNIASTLSIPYSEITSEWLLNENPDVVVKACVSPDAYDTRTMDRLSSCYASIESRPVWSETAALRNNRVHVLAGDVCAGPRAIIGILYMAKWFHPRAMADLDPEGLHREYLQTFHDMPFRGVYIYPAGN